MTDAAGEPQPLFSADARQREILLSAFEEAWFRGESPRIADYLRGPREEQDRLLPELILVDLELRLKRAEDVRVEEYLREFPQFAGNREALLRLIVHEAELRSRAGAAPSAAELRTRFPWLVDQLPARLRPILGEPDREPDTREGTVAFRVIDGPHRGLEYFCRGHQTLVVGRSTAAQLRVNKDRHFSRFQFRVEVALPEISLIDLDSRNGTWVNGEPVRRAFLQNGDVISGGRTKIAVVVASAPGTVGRVAAAARRTVGLPRIPGYELVAEIGGGTTGRVYRAVERVGGEPVAIKVIEPARGDDHDATRRFVRDAAALCRLEHPGIVRLREVGLADGRPFLVMDHVETVSRDEILESAAPAERTRRALGIALRVLEALDGAHRNGVVHGGLKPSNVLLSRSGGRLIVRLTDFGLARCYLASGLSGITGEAELASNVAYLPPEQILDCRLAQPATDLYAVGMLLYRDLAGRTPFEIAPGRSPLAVVLNEIPAPLDGFCPDLPSDLVAAVHRAIARDPRRRFRTAAEMHEVLHGILERSGRG